MAKEVIFRFQENVVKTSLTKVDRDKVYGWSEVIYTDKSGNFCAWATLLDDGVTLVGTGGTALRTFNKIGKEINKSDLIPVFDDGSAAILINSVFDVETILSNEKSIEDLMNLEVKSVYQLEVLENKDALKNWLTKYKVLYLTFNYRTDYEGDDAFILNQDDLFFIITGSIKDFRYVSLQTYQNLEVETDESEEIDFNMF